MSKFAERIYELRISRNISQEGLAGELGISRGAIAYYESGERSPNINVLRKMAQFFNVTTDYLLSMGEDEEIPKIPEFRYRLKQLRNEKDMSLTQVAASLGRGDSAIRMWEAGKSKPDMDTVIQLSQLFDCSLDYLFGLSNASTILEPIER